MGCPKPNALNYTTAIALTAFQAANRDGKYDRIIKGSQVFLKEMTAGRWGREVARSDFFGGAGDGGRNSRPDLSNTAFMIEALRDTGLPSDDPALGRRYFCLALPESEERVQRPALGQQSE